MALAPHEFPIDRLENRLAFLQGRAEVHLASVSEAAGDERNMLALACAATLYRDAACVALLLERPWDARYFLHVSGSRFLELGLPVGASFIALAAAPDAENTLNKYDDVIEGARQQWAPREARERGREKPRPMADQARSEPRQVLAMMQTEWLTNERRSERIVADQYEPVRSALRRNGGHPAGATGLSIDSYAATAEWLSRHASDDVELPNRVAVSISTMMATRAEHLRAARKDRFHWKAIARPAELVDLDATILMYLAMDQLGRPKKGLEDIVRLNREDAPLLDAPVQIASFLRQNQGPEFSVLR